MPDEIETRPAEGVDPQTAANKFIHDALLPFLTATADPSKAALRGILKDYLSQRVQGRFDYANVAAELEIIIGGADAMELNLGPEYKQYVQVQELLTTRFPEFY
ncbi:MAG: hypothetical protein HYS86_02095 [Candidatus Chisholmbacteria bacterium]|nr:hypothetical protein [Candidatus Chisholmbacteria bacterium]